MGAGKVSPPLPPAWVYSDKKNSLKAKAYLQLRLHAVLVCQTAQHKIFVMDNLKKYVKSNNLVSLAGSPPKPKALINYEARARKATVKETVTSSQPLVPTVPMAQVVPFGESQADKGRAVAAKAPTLKAFGSALI